jgi:hypothetical protein
MTQEEIKKAAEAVMQHCVNEFSGQCDPHKYQHSLERYKEFIHEHWLIATSEIQGAALLMIHIGMARAGEYNSYPAQIDTIMEHYLAEFQKQTG